MNKRQLIYSLCCAGAALLANSVAAQSPSWPQKPMKLIVPYIAGSAPDVLGRALVERLGPALGQTFVVENRPGAGGNIGFEALAKAPKDGYTFGMATSGLGINAYLYKKVPFDVQQDYSFLNLAFEMPHALIVASDSPFKSIQDLVAAMKASPGKYDYSSGGNGTGAHLAAELFKSITKTRSTHIPYRGAPSIITSVMAGEVTFGFPTLATVIPLAKAGKVKVLGVTSAKRNSSLPDVPAIGEAFKEYEVTSWFGLIGPSHLPPEVARRVDQEMSKIVADPAFRAAMQAAGTDVIGLNSKEFATFFSKDLARWKQAVEASGAKVD
jgi:tripartite-type tricarboxylate transporter receptor subunit TctC